MTTSGRRGALVGVALCAAVASAGLAATAAGSPARSAGTATARAAGATLVVNTAQAPATVDPGAGCLAPEVGFIANFYARLTQFGTKPGPNGTQQVDTAVIKPWLAKSWKISKDGLTYTFKLRGGLKFPSGKPVNAAAVKFSWDRAIKMGLCGSAFILDNRFTPPVIKSITTPDASTVVLHLSGPNQNMLQDVATPAAGIVDPSVVNAHGGVQKGKVNTWMSSHAAGYGPFLLQSYTPNKQAVLVANPTFFQKPASQKIVVNFISADSTLLLQARSGQADVTLGLSKQAVHSLEGNSCCKIVANDTPFAQQLVFNDKSAPFTNVKLREALTYAVPYDQILQKIVYGYGTPFYGEWVPYMPWFDKTIGKPRPYDVDKAKQLLKASGVKTPINVAILLTEGDNVAEQIATTLQSLWKGLGVNVTLNKQTSANYIDTLNAHKFQAAMYLDGPGVVAPDYYWGYDATCGVVFSYTQFCNKQADKLIAKLRITKGAAARKKLTDEANKLWIAGSPAIKLYADRYVAVLGKNVNGYYYSLLPEFRQWSKS
jgi:peptide/nickel transport system substrate-binding protein